MLFYWLFVLNTKKCFENQSCYIGFMYSIMVNIFLSMSLIYSKTFTIKHIAFCDFMHITNGHIYQSQPTTLWVCE